MKARRSRALAPVRPAHQIAPCSTLTHGALTGAYPYGKARRRTPGLRRRSTISTGVETHMVKPEWGTKRTCPKCSTRFYDLGTEDPVHCISCGTDWVPDPVLKSKQPMAFEAAPVAAKEPAPDPELEAEELAVDEDA